MKKLVKYTIYFEYEDPYWDDKSDEDGTGEEHLRYFIEEHNCHTNFLNDITKSMELAGDDICGAGTAKIVDSSQIPDDIQPYTITKKEQ